MFRGGLNFVKIERFMFHVKQEKLFCALFSVIFYGLKDKADKTAWMDKKTAVPVFFCSVNGAEKRIFCGKKQRKTYGKT